MQYNLYELNTARGLIGLIQKEQVVFNVLSKEVNCHIHTKTLFA